MLRGNSDPTGALLLGMGGGVLLFYRGFRRFREYKVVADTPRIPIRSMPMGLVQIRGRAQSEQLVQSPLTHTPCCFYKVVVERWKTEEHSGSWQHHFTDRDGIKFYLQDDTGRVLVDSYSAEYELPESAMRVVDGSHPASVVAPTASSATPDLEILQYVEKGAGHQYMQKAEHWLEARGTQQDPRKEQARQHFLQLMQAGLEFQKEGKLPVDLIQKAIESRGPLPDANQEFARQAVLSHIRETGTLPVDMKDFGGSSSAASGRYRLHEYLILPGQEYFVTGTCSENAAAKDGQDRNVIEQGRNEKTFLVSAKPVEVETKDLRWSAFKMVLGGAGLTLGCLAGLLLRFHMF